MSHTHVVTQHFLLDFETVARLQVDPELRTQPEETFRPCRRVITIDACRAQFETIYPFTDGNGRVGRALMHATLARRGLLTGLVLPTSLVLATLGDGYVEALSLFREPANRKPNGSAAQSIPGTGRDAWIAFFLKEPS